MFPHSNLALLIFVLTFQGQVRTGQVIGGHEAVPHSRPYMALLERTAHGHSHGKRYCDGFLLNEDFVMTAAHCQAKSYNVLLGVHNFFNQTGVQNLSVGQEFPHKAFNATSFQNDIMLLKLTTKATFSMTVRPIALADKNDISFPTSCIVSGWGQTKKDNGASSHLLMEANVTLIKDKGCEERNEYCSEDDHGPGNGDSGGPLVCGDGKAYGVVSAFRIYGPPFYRYSKIPDYREWMDHILGNY